MAHLAPAGELPVSWRMREGANGQPLSRDLGLALGLVLFGGGFAVAQTFQTTGLSTWVGESFRALGITSPLLLVLPATIRASCGFMLPIATPPNAIVFGSGRVSMAAMVRSGLVLNLLGVVLVTVMFLWLARPLLGIDLESLPEWALPPLPAR